ncbi:hypothetical protein CLG96_06625 [Sphingomonas oleivorans]|uniref:Uncharacterized protein n=2 Tax=Sphingomonas oleivorans TaxID=1735121 RepID=A0A2T5FZY0_9SPHN|nr:hypothetical protein CLG96_06625 [Sphingomonas oleivorans]
MSGKIMRIALALVIAVVPSIAQAGWQGTEWGMDRAAVRKLISFPLTDVRAPNPYIRRPT